MVLVTVLMIIAWELIVIMFAYIYHIIPLKNYSENIPKIQLFFSACSVITGLVALFYVKTYYSSGIFNASKWDETGIKIILIIPFLSFAVALFGNFYRKSHVLPKEETIFLKAEEYQIVKDFDLMMGDYMYMPNVKSYCEFSGGKILFPINVPEHEVDCAFTCRMVKDGIYECFEYKALSGENNKLSFSRIKQIIIWSLGAVDVVLIGIWLSQDPKMHIDVVSHFMPGLSLSLFGTMLIELLKGTKGLFSKIMIAFSISFILVGILSFFK